MDEETQIIYEELKEVARAGQTRFYGDLSEVIELHPRSSRFHSILDTISRHEHNRGRPLLSALAVARGYRIPGSGFFDMAANLGKHDFGGDSTAHVVFWADEVQRLWDYWRNH